MTTPTAADDAEARGDLAQALLPDAAGLAVAVREESREEIAQRLASLDRHELEALAVVLAAMVDPDQPLAQALDWVDFDEYGDKHRLTKRSKRPIGAFAPDRPVTRGAGVDEIAVGHVLAGHRMPLNRAERALAISRGMQAGKSFEEMGAVLGMDAPSVQSSWERTKRAAREAGMPVPQRPAPAGAVAA